VRRRFEIQTYFFLAVLDLARDEAAFGFAVLVVVRFAAGFAAVFFAAGLAVLVLAAVRVAGLALVAAAVRFGAAFFAVDFFAVDFFAAGFAAVFLAGALALGFAAVLVFVDRVVVLAMSVVPPLLRDAHRITS
jgi:hypothetical protein